MRDQQQTRLIDWVAVAETLGTIQQNGEIGSSRLASEALELILGEEAIRATVDHYISLQKGFELARSVLWLLKPWAAMQRCFELYNESSEIEVRRSAVELLRVVADSRVLPWIEEFLSDPDEGVQNWGAGIVDQLLFSHLVKPEACKELLEEMKTHENQEVRRMHAYILDFLSRHE